MKKKTKSFLKLEFSSCLFALLFALAGCYGSNGAKDEEESQGKVGGQSGGDTFGKDFNPDIAKVGNFNNSFTSASTPQITITNQSLLEGNNGISAFLFTLTYTPGNDFNIASASGAQVDYTTEEESATEGQDYFATSGTLTFAQGEWTKVIEVPVVGDTDVEGDESFYLNLSNPQGASLLSHQATGTIVDDDSPILLPVISVADSSITESDAHDQSMVFNVSLHRTSLDPVSVDYWTLDGSAKAGDDYQATSGTLDFAPGEDQKEIAIPLKGDLDPEHEEYFFLTLSNPVNAHLDSANAEGTIKDDDQGDPEVSTQLIAADRNVPEGDSGALEVAFTVTLGSPLIAAPIRDLKLDLTSSQSTAVMSQRSSMQTSSKEVFLDYETLNGSAEAGVDYEATSGSLHFAAGETEKTIKLTILGDTLQEGDESFILRFTNVVGALMKNTSVTVTILDDDGTNSKFPKIGFLKQSGEVLENKGSAIHAEPVHVTLDKPSIETVSIDYLTVDGSATNTEDYESKSGTLTFAPGEVHKVVEVNILDDQEKEGDEIFQLELKNPINGQLDQSNYEIKILDDESLGGGSSLPKGGGSDQIQSTNPFIGAYFVDDFWVREGDDGTTDAIFKVNLLFKNHPAFDFTSATALQFPEITLEYETIDGTAIAGQDYQATSGTLTFTPALDGSWFNYAKNLSHAEIRIPITGDKTLEEDKHFSLKLKNPVAADGTPMKILVDKSICIIGDDDKPASPATVHASKVRPRVIEGDESHGQNKHASFQISFMGGEVPLSADSLRKEAPSLRIEWGFNISLDPAVSLALRKRAYGDQPLSIDYTTVDGSATAGQDYQSVSGNFTFDPTLSFDVSNPQSLSSIQIEVPTLPDSEREPDERFLLKLSNPVNVMIAPESADAVGTITDDDTPQDAFDFNGDGLNDLMMGAPQTKDASAGMVNIFFGGPDLIDTFGDPSASHEPDVILQGSGTNEMFGYSMACVGDMNGDGFDDIVVGAPGYNDHAGAVYIFYGFDANNASPRGLSLNSDQADVVLVGETSKKISAEKITGGDQFGFSVSSAGDFNGDGLDDVIVGAPMYDDGWGAVYIFSGSSFSTKSFSTKKNGSEQVPAENLSNTYQAADKAAQIIEGNGRAINFPFRAMVKGHRTDIFELEIDPYLSFGSSDDDDSDSNDDDDSDDDNDDDGFNVGIDKNGVAIDLGDVGIKSDEEGNSTTEAKIRGIKIDLWITELRIDFRVKAKIGIIDLFDGKNPGEEFTRSKTYSRGQFGYSVSYVRDFNGDGFDDVIVGQPRTSVGEFWDAGGVSAAYLFLGSTRGAGKHFERTESDAEAAFFGVGSFGTAVSGIGDFNNDGFGDVAISAPTKWRVQAGNDNEASLHGGVNIFAGRVIDTSKVIVGDQQVGHYRQSTKLYDPSSHFLVPAGKGVWDQEWNGPDDDSHLFEYSGLSNRRTHSLVLGELDADWFFSRKDPSLLDKDEYPNGSALEDEALYYPKIKKIAEEEDDNAGADIPMMFKDTPALNGWSLSHAGDFDADGYDDVFIGCPGWGRGSDKGTGFIAYGMEKKTKLDWKGLRYLHLAAGLSMSRFGSSATCFGDLNGDGLDDILVGTKPRGYTPMVRWNPVMIEREYFRDWRYFRNGEYKKHIIGSYGHLNESSSDTVNQGLAMAFLFPGSRSNRISLFGTFKGHGHVTR